MDVSQYTDSCAIQESEGTGFCPHRVKMVPLVTKETMARLGKR